MSKLTNFTYLTHSLRVVEIDGKPWFVAADVCRALGMTHTHNALRPLEEDERRSVSRAFYRNLFTYGSGQAKCLLISESGLYKLILRAHPSRPEVAAFQDWVTREVLPAIRKDGLYVAGEEKVRTGEMSPEELFTRMMQGFSAKIERLETENAALREAVTKARAALG